MWLLEHDAVHVLASDAHDDKQREPNLSKARDAVSKRFGADVARALVLDNPAAIVAGQHSPFVDGDLCELRNRRTREKPRPD
jgi:tyrosine-protein phosphatase YwqE